MKGSSQIETDKNPDKAAVQEPKDSTMGTKQLEDCSLIDAYRPIFTLIAEGNYGKILEVLPQQQSVDSQQSAQQCYLRGLAYLLSKQFEQALEELKACVDAGYESEYLLFNTANALRSLGFQEDALAYFNRALDIKGQFPECQHNRALALADLNQHEAAINALRVLLSQTPDYYLASFSLGNLLRSAGQPEQALRAYQEAIQYYPSYVDAFNNKGLCHAALGDHTKAISSYRLGLSILPTDINCLQNLAQALVAAKHHNDAIDEYKQLLLLPLNEAQLAATIQSYLGTLLELNRLDEAQAFIASQANPILKDLYTLHLLPVIYTSEDQAKAIRANYSTSLKRLRDRTHSLHASDPLMETLYAHAWLLTNFYLAYQMEDDRELQTSLSNWLTEILSIELGNFTEGAKEQKENEKRYRIGFISPNLRNHNGCFWSLPLFRALSNSGQAELFAYNLGEESDYVTDQFASIGQLKQLPLNAATAKTVFSTIRADNLDLLFFTDVGMHPASKVASLMKLARHQAVGWGHPVTTGSSQMDFYLSGEWMETPESQSFYSERLCLLPRSGVCYDPPLIEDVEVDLKEHYDLPPDRPLLLSLQSSFKYHPKHDDLYAEISRRNPEALIVLVGHMGNQEINRVLLERMEQSYSSKGLKIQNHVRILPRLPYGHYVGLYGIAHHALDTPDWNGGNSSFQAFAQQCPVVTLPGRYMRGRHTVAMLKVMEIGDLVAANSQEYIDISSHLLNDPSFHADIKQRLGERSERLFRDEGIAQAFQTWALKTCAQGREAVAHTTPA